MDDFDELVSSLTPREDNEAIRSYQNTTAVACPACEQPFDDTVVCALNQLRTDTDRESVDITIGGVGVRRRLGGVALALVVAGRCVSLVGAGYHVKEFGRLADSRRERTELFE